MDNAKLKMWYDRKILQQIINNFEKKTVVSTTTIIIIIIIMIIITITKSKQLLFPGYQKLNQKPKKKYKRLPLE